LRPSTSKKGNKSRIRKKRRRGLRAADPGEGCVKKGKGQTVEKNKGEGGEFGEQEKWRGDIGVLGFGGGYAGTRTQKVSKKAGGRAGKNREPLREDGRSKCRGTENSVSIGRTWGGGGGLYQKKSH